MNEPLTDRLARARQALQRRQWLSGLLYNLLTVCVLLLALVVVNRYFPLQERQAFVLFLPVFAFFLLRLGWDTYRCFIAPPSLSRLAEELEKKHPRWMDALICAVEQEERPEDSRRELERMLVDTMRRKTAGVDFEAHLLPRGQRNRALFLLGGAVLVLLWPVLAGHYAYKAGHYAGDLFSGTFSGIHVEPGDFEVPIETDARVSAEVLRWEDEAYIQYQDAAGEHRYRMNRNADRHTFTFYEVADPIRYRVVTPALVSGWYEIRPFVPPAIESLEVTVTPPEYTGREERSFSQIRSFSVLEGTRVRWELELPEGVSAAFVRNGEAPEPLTAEGGTRRSLELTIDGELSGRFLLEDGEGRSVETDGFTVAANRDYPPVVDVRRPGDDIESAPDERVAVQADVTDDFGVREVTLNLSVSGQRQVEDVLYRAGGEVPVSESPLEHAAETVIDLERLDVREGDVVTWFLTATDNRRPDPQTTRSEVFFIEVRRESQPVDMPGEDMEQEEFDIRALLVESKRLIRNSWETLALEDRRAEDRRDELARSMEALRIETVGKTQELIDLVGGADAMEGVALGDSGEVVIEDGNVPPVIELMHRASRRMGDASELIEAARVGQSIPFQEQALAHLLAVENELRQDEAVSDEPGEGEPGEGEPSEADQPGEEEIERMMESLSGIAAELRRLADGQGRQNTSIDHMRETGPGEEERRELRERQTELAAEARRIRGELSSLPGMGEAWREVDAAASSMDRAGRRIEEDALEGAGRDGGRARASVLAASEIVEELLEQMTDTELNRLIRQADDLARQQGDAAQASRGLAGQESPDPEEIDRLRERQEDLHRAFGELLSQVDDAALEMRGDHPEVGEAISRAARHMRDRNVGGDMERALNALLYRRMDRAGEMQEEIARELELFVEDLQEAGEGLPAVSRQELAEAIQQIRQARREVREMFGEAGEEMVARMEDIQRDTGSRLAELAEAFGDDELREISGELSGEGMPEGMRPNPLRLDSLLSAADRSLEQKLLSMEVERRLRIGRGGGEAPERYRRLVEEYFRNLSETQ